MPIIGIDLGTSNSLVSYWENNHSIIIPNALGNNLTPSVVGVNDDGEMLVGQIAKERLITHPHLTAATFKRYMGSEKTCQLGTYTFLPEELSSFIIRSLVQDAEAYFGQKVSEAVISVPAYFSDAQRKATKRAGELAGLKVERLINEPTAAAIAYGLHQQEAEAKWLVFDLGGGTFDVSIVELFDNLIEVKAIAGDNYLGGEDFTDCLVSAFIQYHQIDREGLAPKAYAAIKKQAEICKRSLGQDASAKMSCTINETLFEWNVDYKEFETICKPLLNRLRYPVEKALRDAVLRAKDLDAVILVGGATRMPLIHTLVSRMLSRFPVCSINPDEVVAAGAGIQAAMKERNALLSEVVLTDVCPYTLGISVSKKTAKGYESGYFSPIIERNTVIPVSRMDRFYTIYDKQKAINVKIFQGESRLVQNNIKMGQLEIEVPAAPAGEQAIDVRFTYDINGILEVEVVAIETGVKERLVIEESPGTMSQEEIEQRLAVLSDIKIHPRDKQENKLLIVRGERLYEELLGEAREKIAWEIQQFEILLEKQDDKEIKKAAKLLKGLLDEMEFR